MTEKAGEIQTHVAEQHMVKQQKIKGLSVNYTRVPNLFGTRDRFSGRYFFRGPWGGWWLGVGRDGFGMIQALYIIMHFISDLLPLLI